MSLLTELVTKALCEAERGGPWDEVVLPEDANLPFSKVVADLEAAGMIEVKRAGGIESARLLSGGSEMLRALRDSKIFQQLNQSQSVIELRDTLGRLPSTHWHLTIRSSGPLRMGCGIVLVTAAAAA